MCCSFLAAVLGTSIKEAWTAAHVGRKSEEHALTVSVTGFDSSAIVDLGSLQAPPSSCLAL